MQFTANEKKSNSTATTSSSTPRQANKFLKKTAAAPPIPGPTEKLSVAHSPRDVTSPRTPTRPHSAKIPQPPPSSSGTGLLTQSALLARAVHRQQLFAKGIELEPGAFDQNDDDDDTSSDATSTSAAKILFGSGKKSFLKKTATTAPENKVPELQHLDSETNDSERDRKKGKHKKNTRPASGMHPFVCNNQLAMVNSSFCT